MMEKEMSWNVNRNLLQNEKNVLCIYQKITDNA